MSTKETLPTDERFIKWAWNNGLGWINSDCLSRLFKQATSTLLTRLDAAEKELVLHNHRCEARHNEGRSGMPQGDCQCEICSSFYKELTQLKEELEKTKERLSEVSKGTLMVENLRLKEANAALVKDKERLDRMQADYKWVKRLHYNVHGDLVGWFVIGSNNPEPTADLRQAIDAAAAKGTQ